MSLRRNAAHAAVVPCLAVALAVSAFAAPSAAAATGKAFTVNSTADAPDANLANGTCATSTGTCTLRAAIMQANHTAAADTIKLPKGRAGT